MSYNEKTKKLEYKTVASVFTAIKTNIVKLKIKGEKQVFTTTTEHPFYIQKARVLGDKEGGEWKTAEELKVGDKVLSKNGKWTPIVEISRDDKPTKVYNFEVEENHNYYVGDVGILSHNCDVFVNQLPGLLKAELATAKRLGVNVARVGESGFDAAINSGTIKWAVDGNGNLLIMQKYARDGTEIKHSVLTGGKPVLAAGEADIAGSGGAYFGLELNRNSGHFLPSQESLEIGKKAFAKAGITFPQ